MLAGLLSGWRNGGPAERQLAATVRALVLDGRLPLESRVPAERELATALGVSRASIASAYEQLGSEGLLRPQGPAGPLVADRPAPRAAALTPPARG